MRAKMEHVIKTASEFANKNKVAVYCGEFGVIKFADDGDAVKWYTDLIGLFEKYGIGHAVWNYKEEIFRLQNFQTGTPNLELFKLLAR